MTMKETIRKIDTEFNKIKKSYPYSEFSIFNMLEDYEDKIADEIFNNLNCEIDGEIVWKYLAIMKECF